MKKENGNFQFWASVSLGILAIAALTLCIKAVFCRSGIFPLLGRDGGVSDYLALVGVSFSVTFITTSLLGGLSDKSEKIYWLNYPDHYLINSVLNFNSISCVGYLCLAIQTVMTFLEKVEPALRESIFLSAFVISILAIILLTYKFTAVFFSRKRLLRKAEAAFRKMLDSPEELEKAVIAIYNYSIEAASQDNSNLERLRENVSLLLEYDENEMCSFWLTRLIVELGRINDTILIQLTSMIKSERFYRYLEGPDFTDSLSDESYEVLKSLYSLRIDEVKRSLGGESFLSGGEHQVSDEKAAKWEEADKRAAVILKKIRLSSASDCVFWISQLEKLPYDLLRQDHCYEAVLSGWDQVLHCLTDAMINENAGASRSLPGRIFGFLHKHPAKYYDDTLDCLRPFTEQLGKELNGKTAACVDGLSKDRLPYMMDMMESEDDRQNFTAWLTEQMAEESISAGMWGASKPTGYRYTGKHSYSDVLLHSILVELHRKEAAVLREPSAEYARNVSLRKYLDYIKKMTALLSRVKKFEENAGTSSLERFITEAARSAFVGRPNSFAYEESICTPDGFTEETAQVNLNCYAIILDALMKEGAEGLTDLREALTVWHSAEETVENYYPDEAEEKQKRSEFLFFLEKLNDIAVEKENSKEETGAFAGIMARVLSNPCMNVETYNTSEAVKNSLAFIKAHPAALDEVNDFLWDLDFYDEEDPSCSALYQMLTHAENESSTGNEKAAKRCKEAAKDYEKSLALLRERLNNA